MWRMMLMAGGMGLVMAPATESIMGSLPRAKAGVGSAVNDTTRQVGGALGVAIIGSVMSSVYHARLAKALSGRRTIRPVAEQIRSSLGGAIGVAHGIGGPAGAFIEGRSLRSSPGCTRRCSSARPPPSSERAIAARTSCLRASAGRSGLPGADDGGSGPEVGRVSGREAWTPANERTAAWCHRRLDECDGNAPSGTPAGPSAASPVTRRAFEGRRRVCRASGSLRRPLLRSTRSRRARGRQGDDLPALPEQDPPRVGRAVRAAYDDWTPPTGRPATLTCGPRSRTPAASSGRPPRRAA